MPWHSIADDIPVGRHAPPTDPWSREVTPRELIDRSPATVIELRAAASSPQISPERRDMLMRAAATLERFIELAQVMKAGRHAFSNLVDRGKTILDFFNVWLDHERDVNTKLRNEVERLKAEIDQLKGAPTGDGSNVEGC